MKIRFKLFVSCLFSICFAILFIIRNQHWFLSKNQTAFDLVEIELIFMALICLLSGLFSDYFTKYSLKLVSTVRQVLHFLKQTPNLLVQTPVLRYIIMVSMISAFVIYKDSQPPPESPTRNLTKIHQKILNKRKAEVRLQQQIKTAVERNIFRKALNLESRPQDEALLRLAGADMPKNIPRVSEFNFKLRQELVLRLVKINHEAGSQCDFNGATLYTIDLSRSLLKTHGLEGSLAGADFGSALLDQAKFKDTNLQRANFSKASLTKAHLIGSNLIDANFEGANLQGAILSNSRLKGAQLSRTYLLQTFFIGAFINGAIVDSPIWIKNYHQLNRNSRAFSIRWHSLVEVKDEQGISVYVFQGDDPPIQARKP